MTATRNQVLQSGDITFNHMAWWVTDGVIKDGGAFTFPLTSLEADTTYYVRSDGSDGNTGLTNNTSGAWLTPDHAFAVVKTINLNGFTLTVHFGTNTWNGGPFQVYTPLGAGNFIIEGNGSANTSISLWARLAGGFELKSITIDGGISSTGTGLTVGEHAEVVIDDTDVVFGGAANNDILCYDYGAFSWNASYTITGVKAGTHFRASEYARGNSLGNFVINATGTTSVGSAFVLLDDMASYNPGSNLTGTGTVTGRKYFNRGIGVMAGTPDNIPGSLAGLMYFNALGGDGFDFRSDNDAGNALNQYSYSTSGFEPIFAGRMSGGTIQVPVNLGSGINVVSLYAKAFGGGSFRDVGQAVFVTEETISGANNIGTSFRVLTGPFATAGGIVERFKVDSKGNFTIGTGALATNVTDGFLYIPTCAGVPSGTPTTKTGLAPMIIDTADNRFYFYSSGAWRNAGP